MSYDTYHCVISGARVKTQTIEIKKESCNCLRPESYTFPHCPHCGKFITTRIVNEALGYDQFIPSFEFEPYRDSFHKWYKDRYVVVGFPDRGQDFFVGDLIVDSLHEKTDDYLKVVIDIKGLDLNHSMYYLKSCLESDKWEVLETGLFVVTYYH